MKGVGQLRGLRCNTGSQCQKLNTWVGKSQVQPLPDGPRKGQTLKLDELGHLPAGNRADADSRLLRVDIGAQSRWKTRIAVDPPNPNVRVENHHGLLRCCLPVALSHSFERT